MLVDKIQLLFNNLGIQIISVEYIGSGVNSTVYRVEADKIYGIKIANYPERKSKVLGEVKIRHSFINKGIKCIPEIYFTDTEVFKNGAVIYQFIDGDKPDFSQKRILKQFAYTLAKIHKLSLKKIENGFDTISNNMQTLKEHLRETATTYTHLATEGMYNSLRLAIEELENKTLQGKQYFKHSYQATSHGDLSDNFIIDRDEKIWLLDWENSEENDIIEEIFFFTNINLEDNKLSYFIDCYKKYLPEVRDIDFINIRDTYLCTMPLFYIFWNIDFINTYLKNGLNAKEKYNDLLKAVEMCRKYISVDLVNNLKIAFEKSSIPKLVQYLENS